MTSFERRGSLICVAGVGTGSAVGATAASRLGRGRLGVETETFGGLRAMGKKSKNGVPDRWTHYIPLGKRIPGTRFIAFKVPLKKTFDWKLAPNERFSPLDLINQVAEQKEELGLVIDLTYTTRYYEPEELLGTTQYCKIVTFGHEVPNNETVFEFKSAVKKFLMENQHNDKLIGVHCTHGLNRTGYLVCRYLIDVEGMDPNMAIELFNSCRGHSIERKNYIDALRGGSGRRNHHMAASGRGWMKGYHGPVGNPGFQAITYSQQHLQQFPLETPRHFPPRRGRGGQNPQRKPYHTSHRNLINCYDSGQSVYHPQYLPTAGITQQGLDYPVRPSQGLHYSSYQQQWQGHAGPHFPVQSPHYPQQQGRYKIDRRHR
ncbi:RNA/RNP complex-1-interacting phosphatase [Lacerta agilis]|uniref:RNA/RNP complex-1-interacting phosphatase n=1 Tax=Lacerta agilis TaxID=80427 RepID=UPI00141A20C3|nr:RNA/RNP complex-1-interacting phosphatase [Lacerta agilis]